MLIKINKKIKIIIGNFNLKDGPSNIFDKDIILLLNEISKEVLNSSKCKQFSDLVSFGFWFLTEEIQYHDGLRSRELGQAPILLCAPNS